MGSLVLHESRANGEDDSTYDCNICLDQARDPVVTMCGHLYCWKCLYQWTRRQQSCPVCKDHVNEDRVIPIYGRHAQVADSAGPRQRSAFGSDTTPLRPAGFRLLMHQREVERAYAARNGDTSERHRGTRWFGSLPSLSPPQQAMIIQTLLLIGCSFILFLLIWS